MERCLQALDDLDDFLIGLRQASMPWLAALLAGILGARAAARTVAFTGARACVRLVAIVTPHRVHYVPQRFH